MTSASRASGEAVGKPCWRASAQNRVACRHSSVSTGKYESPPDVTRSSRRRRDATAPMRVNSRLTSEPATALIRNRRTVTSASQSEWAGVKKHNLPHDSVVVLEQRPMGTQRIDAAHPLFLRRIARIVGDLFDFVNPTQCRLDVLAMLLLGHLPQFPVWPTTRCR